MEGYRLTLSYLIEMDDKEYDLLVEAIRENEFVRTRLELAFNRYFGRKRPATP